MSMVSSGSSVPAVQIERPEGLEDFGVADQVIPQLRVNHTEMVFEDSLSGAKYSEVTVVMLGLVKQRVLWPPQLTAEKELPLCRSYDFNTGHPSAPEEREQPDGSKVYFPRFPWAASRFPMPDAGVKSQPLPCASCPLKEWGSHPTKEQPWCSEQHTFALLIPNTEGQLVPMLFQLQRTGLKPSKQYLSSFANAQEPLFTVFTKITLEAKKMGSNTYCTPKFVRDQTSPVDMHPFFSSTYRGIRAFLQTPRGDDEAVIESDIIPDSVAPAPAPEPAAAQAPVAEAPVQATPPAPAPVAAQPPPPAPAAPAPAPAPPAPVAAPTPAPAPTVAPEPAVAPPAAPAAAAPAPAPAVAPEPAVAPAAPAPAPAAEGVPAPAGMPMPAPAGAAPAPAPAAALAEDELPF